jgi:hypothetical protein
LGQKELHMSNTATAVRSESATGTTVAPTRIPLIRTGGQPNPMLMQDRQTDSIPDLDALIADIRREAQGVIESVRRGLVHARNCGEHLSRAKDIVGHGGWKTWVEKNIDLSKRTAQVYISIYEGWAEIEAANPQRAADLSIRAALRLLSKPQATTAPTMPLTPVVAASDPPSPPRPPTANTEPLKIVTPLQLARRVKAASTALGAVTDVTAWTESQLASVRKEVADLRSNLNRLTRLLKPAG